MHSVMTNTVCNYLKTPIMVAIQEQSIVIIYNYIIITISIKYCNKNIPPLRRREILTGEYIFCMAKITFNTYS